MISNRDSSSNRSSSSQLAEEVQKKKKAMQAKAVAEEGDKEKKRMMIAYIGIGILAVLLVGFAIMKSSSTEETKETDFATPETNSDKYNTKLEALEAKQKRTNNSNLLDIFSNDKETDSIENDTLEEYKLKQNLKQLNKEPKQKKQSPKRVQSSNKSKKDVYGDYSMWEEEKENEKNKTTKRKVKSYSNSKELTYEEKLKLAKQARYGNSTTNNKINKETQKTRIAIFRDQFLLPGQLAELVLTKDFTYNNKLFKKGTPVYGYININKSRVLFDIKNIAHQPLNIEVRDIRDGLIGMYSNRAGELWKKYEAEGINDATDGITSDITSNGILSNSIDVVSKFFQKKRLNKNDYIMLLNDQELIVTIINK